MDVLAYVWPGAILCSFGFLAVFGLLASERALARRKQLAALANVAAGRSGRTKRLVLGCAALALATGACASFAGVAARDGERARRCEQTCTDRGYADARIRGSTEMENAGRHAFVACACSGGPAPDPLELDAEALMQR